MGKGMDDGAALDGDARTEDHIRLDQNILGNLRIESEEHGFRGNHRHTGHHHLVSAALLPDSLDHRQLGAVVAAGQFRFRCLDGNRLASPGADDLNDIGQVIFTLGIGIADLAEQFQRLGAIDCHQAAVAIGDLLFVLGRILLLADRHKRAVVDEQPAVTGGIGGLKADDDDIVAVGEPLACGQKRCRGDQRRVAEDDENIVITLGDGVLCGENGMAGAEALSLEKCRHIDVTTGGGGLNRVRIAAENKRHRRNRRVHQRFHHMRDHRAGRRQGAALSTWTTSCGCFPPLPKRSPGMSASFVFSSFCGHRLQTGTILPAT